MAKARCNSSQKAGMLRANPTSSSAIPEIPADVLAAQQTGDTIPTPENVPAVRKKTVELQHEMEHQGQLGAASTTVAATGTAHIIAPTPGSPTKPVAESNFVSSGASAEK